MEPKGTNTRKLWLQLCWQMSCLGLIGRIGLGLFVVGTIFFIGVVLPQNNEIKELQQYVETIRSSSPLDITGEGELARKIGGDQALKIFYDFFPSIDTSPQWIGEIIQVARMHKVVIDSSEFHMAHSEDSKLARYEMVLPVSGTYSQIRAFIADSLGSVPAMAITGINIKRKNVKSAQLEMGLKVNLYLNSRQHGKI